MSGTTVEVPTQTGSGGGGAGSFTSLAVSGASVIAALSATSGTFSSPVSVPAGAVNAPGLLVGTSAGLYQPTGASNLAVETGGVQAMLWDSSQNAQLAGRLAFGGATASFPAIKRTATALNFRLADDSADAPITAAAATLSGALAIPAGLSTAPALAIGGEQTGLFLSTAGALGVTAAGVGLFKINVLSTLVQFTSLVNGTGAAGFAFYSGNNGSTVTMDATNGLITRSGGISASPQGRNFGSGQLGFDGNAGSNGAFGAIAANSALASGLSGATVNVGANLIPAGSVIIGVSIRVTTLITSGTGLSFTIGDGTNAAAFGTGIAFTAGTTTTMANWTLTSAPVYASAANIVLTCTGGTFTAGAVRAHVAYIQTVAPTS